MANFRIKLFGLAGVSLMCAGMAYGQATCVGVPVLSQAVRLESGSDLTAESQLGCTNPNAVIVAAGTVALGTAPAITLFVGAPVTSKLLQTGALPAVQWTEALAVVYAPNTTPATSYSAGVIFSATQGVITPAGLSFTGIPTPALSVAGGATAAYTIVFLNVRVNATGGATTISSQAFITGTAAVSSGASVSTVIGTVASGLAPAKLSTDQANAKAISATGLNQTICTSLAAQSASTTVLAAGVQTPAFWVHTGETFQTSFKIAGSVAPASNIAPGNEFTNNTEIGVTPTAAAVALGTAFQFNQTSAAGVTVPTNSVNSGTRIQVVFSNIPAGMAIYVPITVNNDGWAGAPAVPNATLSLTSSLTGPFGPPTPVTATGTFGTFTAPPSAFGAAALNAGAISQVTVTGTTATAVYEVTAANALTIDAFSIPVFLVAAGGTLTASTAPLTTTVSFAPVPTSLAAPLANIPSFVNLSTAITTSNEITCSTTLLFPYVTQGAGFDVGIAIEDTSVDNLGTAGKSSATSQGGTCGLNYYGAGGSITPSATGTLFVNSGSTTAFTFTPYSSTVAATATAGPGASNLLSVLNPGFTGYIIAQCNFQYAHGYAYIFTNYGTANATVTSYLPLVLPTGAAARGGAEFTNGAEMASH